MGKIPLLCQRKDGFKIAFAHQLRGQPDQRSAADTAAADVLDLITLGVDKGGTGPHTDHQRFRLFSEQ